MSEPRRKSVGAALRRILAAALLVGTSVLSWPALAQPSEEDRARAMEKFKAGSTAYGEGRHKDAIDLFLEADAIAPNPAFAYNASLAYEALGDSSNALKWARTYLRRDPDAPDRLEVLAKIATHQKKLASRGLQQVTVLSEPTGATVVVDGRPRGVTPWTGDIAPGDHDVELHMEGYAPMKHGFALPAKRAIDVALTLSVAAPEPEITPPPAPPPPPPPPPAPDIPEPTWAPGPLLFIGVGVGAIGIGGVAAAIGLEVARGGAEDDAQNAATQPEAAEHVDDMEAFQIGARIAVVAGAVLVAGGATLVIFDVTSEPEGEHSALRLGCGRWGCGPAFTGSF
jgi:tetratricopeptide (TPR) repeat protein